MTRTPDEIKKGLRVCDSVGRVLKAESWCKEKCPYMDKTFGCCQDYLLSDALALIQQLEADNAQHARCIENLTDKLNATNEALPRWISVEERLPAYYTDVAVIERNGDASWYMVAYLDVGGIWALNGGRRIIGVVTHWMPLPEPPKE